MDAATDSKVEVKGSMKCTDEQWANIWKTKEVKEESEKDGANNE